MEDIDGVEVFFQGEERGERFIVVEMGLGYSGCVGACAHV